MGQGGRTRQAGSSMPGLTAREIIRAQRGCRTATVPQDNIRCLQQLPLTFLRKADTKKPKAVMARLTSSSSRKERPKALRVNCTAGKQPAGAAAGVARDAGW